MPREDALPTFFSLLEEIKSNSGKMFIKSIPELGMEVCSCNPSTQEAEAGGLGV
jgi:hypothetical protein